MTCLFHVDQPLSINQSLGILFEVLDLKNFVKGQNIRSIILKKCITPFCGETYQYQGMEELLTLSKHSSEHIFCLRLDWIS